MISSLIIYLLLIFICLLFLYIFLFINYIFYILSIEERDMINYYKNQWKKNMKNRT